MLDFDISEREIVDHIADLAGQIEARRRLETDGRELRPADRNHG